jgi:hypothetical protein
MTATLKSEAYLRQIYEHAVWRSDYGTELGEAPMGPHIGSNKRRKLLAKEMENSVGLFEPYTECT